MNKLYKTKNIKCNSSPPLSPTILDSYPTACRFVLQEDCPPYEQIQYLTCLSH